MRGNSANCKHLFYIMAPHTWGWPQPLELQTISDGHVQVSLASLQFINEHSCVKDMCLGNHTSSFGCGGSQSAGSDYHSWVAEVFPRHCVRRGVHSGNTATRSDCVSASFITCDMFEVSAHACPRHKASISAHRLAVIRVLQHKAAAPIQTRRQRVYKSAAPKWYQNTWWGCKLLHS